ncbi:MAG: HAD family phosphatase [Oscillospiraceae bacterium]|nr:HAD family phosphatase [Oscillospiraceae bacterium]
MISVKGAIFDLDGTLLDSMDIWRKIDLDFLAKRGLAASADYVAAITPMGFPEAAEYTVRRFDLDENPADIINEWNAMSVDAYRNSILLKPYVKEYLLFLKKQGVRMAVATASHELLYVPALKNNGIYHLFDAFTTVSEVKRGKGFPDIYRKAAEKMGLLPCDCAVFEDICAGLKGAKDGGFFTVGVYDLYSDYERDKIIELSDLYIHDFSDKAIYETLGD